MKGLYNAVQSPQEETTCTCTGLPTPGAVEAQEARFCSSYWRAQRAALGLIHSD